jgi:hypothetical protein
MHSLRLRAPRLLVLAGYLIFAQTGRAQSAAPASTAIDPHALNALKVMSDELRAANSYSYTVRIMKEEPGSNGQMLQFFKVLHVRVKRPDKLRLIEETSGFGDSVWYDGRNVTLMPASQQIYAVIPTGPTLTAALPVLRDQLGTNQFVRIFLSDDPYATLSDGLSTAREVGFVDIGYERQCQTAYTEPNANWQLWLNGPKPVLPSRIAVVYKTIKGAPRVELEFSEWKLNPQISDQTFVFTKPAGAVQVDFKSLAPRPQAAK